MDRKPCDPWNVVRQHLPVALPIISPFLLCLQNGQFSVAAMLWDSDGRGGGQQGTPLSTPANNKILAGGNSISQDGIKNSEQHTIKTKTKSSQPSIEFTHSRRPVMTHKYMELTDKDTDTQEKNSSCRVLASPECRSKNFHVIPRALSKAQQPLNYLHIQGYIHPIIPDHMGLCFFGFDYCYLIRTQGCNLLLQLHQNKSRLMIMTGLQSTVVLNLCRYIFPVLGKG